MLKKWLIVIAIPLVFQVIFLGVLFASQVYRTQAQAITLHTMEVIAQAEAIGRSLSEARADVQAHLILRNAASSVFAEKKREVVGLFETIHKSVEDNAKSQLVIDDARGRCQRYMDWLAEVDLLAARGRFDEGQERLRSTVPRVTRSEIRERLQVFLEGEMKLDVMRRKRLRRVEEVQTSVLIGGASLTVVMAIGLAVVFSRAFASRIDTLAQNARALAEGRSLAAPLGGNDELVQLDNVFRSMARALAERDQENEMFIYSVSHDLRSPLVNLQGFSKELAYTCDDLKPLLASLEKPPEVEAKLKRMLDQDMPSSIHFIQNAVSRLSAIIDSLLRLSRAGRVEYREQEVDVPEVVKRVVEALESSIKERGAEVLVGDLPTAWGDPTVIEQVFANLLSNAVKYLDPDRRGRIEVGAEAAGEGWSKFFVKDNGLGIAKGHQNKLFHAFQRMHPAAATGEGIGLALVRRMVERHGGKIWAESEAGIGSTFFVTLPSHAHENSAIGRPRPAVAATGDRR